VPVATVALNNAKNAGLLAVRMLGASDDALRARLTDWMERQKETVLAQVAEIERDGYRSLL
jgi:5-(carboxyamino)imidazole ribonucleotide mutase